MDIDETPRPGEAPLAFTRRMAEEKARAGWASRRPGEPPLFLASDTVVTFDGHILGKPRDAAEATSMLRALSGRTHQVITAWSLVGAAGVRVDEAVVDVCFRTLSDGEIEAYVASGDAFDKAGAYGIQGPAGRFVSSVEGVSSAVVGLPIEAVLSALEAAGAIQNASDVERRARCIRARLAAAASGNGRALADLTLVAVSKRQPEAAVADGIACGLSDLGENYVQALAARIDRFEGTPARWHFIGHLQRNKARALAGRVALVHGIDRIKTLAALGRAGVDAGVVVPCLVQVNVGDEASKAGVAPDALGAFLADAASIEGVRVEGLMTIPPPARWAAARRWFAALRSLRDAHATPERPLAALSMGMSNDFEEAVAEGATIVRVGTAIFGSRSEAAAL